MKILMLADPGSAHTIKWVKYLCAKGVEIYLFGLREFNSEYYSGIENLYISSINIDKDIFKKSDGSLSKIKYVKALPSIKKIIKEFKPDIVHAHYATSYGLLGALTGFHPLIISVYGSDVIEFPNKSVIHKMIFKFTLHKAEKILATSNTLAGDVKNFTDKEIEVTPFGIDMNIFRSVNNKERFFNNDDLVIGTVKALEEIYGIEYLISAFKSLYEKYNNLPLKLLIVGGGTREDELKKLVGGLGLSNVTKFTGVVEYSEISSYHNMMDIEVYLSLNESFGVSVLEASACGKPVVVSNVGGLPEVVENNITGFIVEKENIEQAVSAIEKLILDKNLRINLGINGRNKVEKDFNIGNNFKTVLNIYSNVLQKDMNRL